VNYTYHIIIKPYLEIQEIDSKGFQWNWTLEAILNTDHTNEDLHYGFWGSFQRTKKWVSDNHPELIL
jgi:hypothetical protein